MIAAALFTLLAAPALTACGSDDEPFTDGRESVVPENNGDDDGMSDRGIVARIGGVTIAVTLADNASAHAFALRLPLTLRMEELNGNEKYAYIESALPTDSARPGTIRAGDLMLFGSDCLVLFYETFSSQYAYTRLGRLDDPASLAAAVGAGSVTVTFEKQ